MKSQLLKEYSELSEKLSSIGHEIREHFKLKELLEIEYQPETKWWRRDGDVSLCEEGEEASEDDSWCCPKDFGEDEKYFAFRYDYQQGIDDVYIIVNKSNEVKAPKYD